MNVLMLTPGEREALIEEIGSMIDVWHSFHEKDFEPGFIANRIRNLENILKRLKERA